MSLEPILVLALAAQCAPAVAPQTLLALARAESGLNPLALGVNHGAAIPAQPRSKAEAIVLARALIRRGKSVDLGLTQINSANLRRLRLRIEDAFDPCRSLAAAASVLQADYGVAQTAAADAQDALRIAFSLYNTGSVERGFRNGYVARVVRCAAQLTLAQPLRRDVDAEPPSRPAWDVFGDLSTSPLPLSPPFISQGDEP